MKSYLCNFDKSFYRPPLFYKLDLIEGNDSCDGNETNVKIEPSFFTLSSPGVAW